MESHRKVAIDLFVAEIGLHGSVQCFFISYDSAEFKVVGHFGRSLLHLHLWTKGPLLHILLRLLLNSTAGLDIFPPVFIHLLVEDKPIFITLYVFTVSIGLLRIALLFFLRVFCIRK